MSPEQFKLKEKYKDVKEFQVPKLTKARKEGESGTTVVDKKTFIARAEKYIALGYGHYFEGGRELEKQINSQAPSLVIIKHRDNAKSKKAAEALKKMNEGNAADVQIIKK